MLFSERTLTSLGRSFANKSGPTMNHCHSSWLALKYLHTHTNSSVLNVLGNTWETQTLRGISTFGQLGRIRKSSQNGKKKKTDAYTNSDSRLSKEVNR